MLEVELAGYVAQKALGVEDMEADPGGRMPGGGVSVLARGHRPGIGQTLHGIRGPRWWRKARAVAIVSAWLVRRSYGCCRFGVRHPVLAAEGIAALGLVWAVARFGWVNVAILLMFAVGVLMLVVGAWAERYPDVYYRRVHWPAVRALRASWRRTTVYRRHWRPATAGANLARVKVAYQEWPRLGRVRSGRHFDSVRVRLLDGYTVADWAKAGEQLASSFSVEAVRAYPVDRHPKWVELQCRVVDPLRAVVPPLDAVGDVNLSAVPVGRREDGRPLLLPANRHLLIAGQTGSGKSSCMWALVAGVAPAIQAGTLRIRALDPKRQELSAGTHLWDGYCRKGGDEAVKFLEHAVRLMEQRQDALGTRTHTPTVEHPLYVILVDEVAALTAWIKDPRLKARATNALGLLLSQGRASGFIVWQATQLPQKEILDVARDLTPMRVALRTAEVNHVDLILGQGARARGALADQIDPRTPGVCYVLEDGAPEPVRGRLAHVTDADIERIAARYSRKLHAVPAAA